MSELGTFAYCAAFGFVCAATISSFYQWVTSERPDFSVSRTSMPGLALMVVISMFGGPFIVAQKILAGVRSQQIKVVPAVLGVVVAGMWSVCAGIFYLSLMIAA